MGITPIMTRGVFRLIWRGLGFLALLVLTGAQVGCGRVWPGRFDDAGGIGSIRQGAPFTAVLQVSGPVIADGSDSTTISVTLTDANGASLVGVTPTLNVSGTGNAVTCGATNGSGVANCTLRTSEAGAKLVTLASPDANALAISVQALSTLSFRYTWNAPQGAATATLPLVAGAGYDFMVYWGDGTSEHVVQDGGTPVIHNYSTAGSKSILIHGAFTELSFGTHGERVLDVTYWGSQAWTSMRLMFENCVNLAGFTAPDRPNLSRVTNMSGMFKGASIFNHPIGDWDVSNVQDFSEMFCAREIPVSPALNQARPANPMTFNQNIGSWNTASATNFRRMFAGAVEFNQHLGDWETSSVTDMSMMFYYAEKFNKPLNTVGPKWDVSEVTNMSQMFMRAANFDETLNDWTPVKLLTMEKMFAYATVFNHPLAWGGNTPALTSLAETFYYASAFDSAVYLDVSSVISFYRAFSNAANFNQPLESTPGNNWTPGVNVGPAVNISFASMFNGAEKFNQPIGTWNMSRARTIEYMFAWATDFNQHLSSWDTSNVTNMSNAFLRAYSFNNGGPNTGGAPGPPLLWDTSSVTTMEDMFSSAVAFNAEIRNTGNIWNTASVTTLKDMFSGATVFNNGAVPGTVGPSLNWNTGNVTRMDGTFANAQAFNCPLPWNTSKVTTLYTMFLGATDFDQELATSGSTWDVSKVTNMASVFYNAANFNRNLSTWNTSGATTLSRMFLGASKFNNGQLHGSPPSTQLAWDTSKVTNMARMFDGATLFNQEVRFDTLRVSDMYNMFNDARSFNTPLTPAGNIWNTSSVTKMNGMFFNAQAFDQNISGWAVSTVSERINFSGGLNAAGWEESEKPNWPGTPSLPFRKIFLTSASFNGAQIGGISGADAKCMTDLQSSGGIYKALLSNATRYVNASNGDEFDWPLSAYTQYGRPDGNAVVATDGTKRFPVGIYTNPIQVGGGDHWTGLMSDMWYITTSSTGRCLDWISASSSQTSLISSNSGFSSTAISCATSLPLLCIEQ